MVPSPFDTCANRYLQAGWTALGQLPVAEREETVVVFIAKQIIRLHIDCYIRRAANILQMVKKRTM
jgi:hypothetical protein